MAYSYWQMREITDEAIQRLYWACRKRAGFPGVVPRESNGIVPTSAILHGLGLIGPHMDENGMPILEEDRPKPPSHGLVESETVSHPNPRQTPSLIPPSSCRARSGSGPSGITKIKSFSGNTFNLEMQNKRNDRSQLVDEGKDCCGHHKAMLMPVTACQELIPPFIDLDSFLDTDASLTNTNRSSAYPSGHGDLVGMQSQSYCTESTGQDHPGRLPQMLANDFFSPWGTLTTTYSGTLV